MLGALLAKDVELLRREAGFRHSDFAELHLTAFLQLYTGVCLCALSGGQDCSTAPLQGSLPWGSPLLSLSRELGRKVANRPPARTASPRRYPRRSRTSNHLAQQTTFQRGVCSQMIAVNHYEIIGLLPDLCCRSTRFELQTNRLKNLRRRNSLPSLTSRGRVMLAPLSGKFHRDRYECFGRPILHRCSLLFCSRRITVNRFLRTLMLFFAGCLWGLGAHAQLSTATMFGTVTDTTGAAVPGATAHPHTRPIPTSTRRTKTRPDMTASTLFRTSLPVGPYKVSVLRPRASRALERTGITLTVTEEARTLTSRCQRWRRVGHDRRSALRRSRC